MQIINTFDLILIIIFILFIIRGYTRGFIEQISVISGLIISFYLAIKFYPEMHTALRPYMDLSRNMLDFISFAIIFIIFNILIHLIGEGAKGFLDFIFLKPVDQLAGAFLGFVKGLIIIYILLLFSAQIPYRKINILLESSFLAEHLLEMSPVIQKSLENFFRRP